LPLFVVLKHFVRREEACLEISSPVTGAGLKLRERILFLIMKTAVSGLFVSVRLALPSFSLAK